MVGFVRLRRTPSTLLKEGAKGWVEVSLAALVGALRPPDILTGGRKRHRRSAHYF